MIFIRQIEFNEWIRPLKLTKQILQHTPQPKKILLLIKLPLSLLVLKLYNIKTIYVAEKNKQIIGICIGQTKKDTLIIEGTAIHSDYRRLGLSKKLKKKVEAEAKKLGAKRAITKIESSNIIALKMAQSQGYQKINEHDIYEKKLE